MVPIPIPSRTVECSLTPHTIGPTWQTGDEGAWLLPTLTLGWQIIRWCSDNLLSDEGGPWRFTPEQARFVLWFYAVDEHGRFAYREAVLQRMKGWG